MSDSPLSYESFKKKRPAWTRSWRRDLEYQMVRFLAYLGQRLTLERLQALGRGLGRLAYWLLRKDRGIALQQLAQVFPEVPEAQRRAWSRECFEHFGQFLFELFALERVSQEAEQRFSVQNPELLAEVMQQGKGGIVLGLHLGNWEFLTPYFMHTGYTARAVVKPLYDPRLNQFFINLREKGGIHLIPRGAPDTAREILKCFKRNEFFFVLIDQDTDVPSLFVPFFGLPAQTPIVATHLALKTGAPVIMANVIRQPAGHFTILFEKIGQFHCPKPTPRDVFEVTSCFNQHIERIIRQYPTQWAWFHRRWKHRPTPEEWKHWEELQTPSSSPEARHGT